jgi:hypothetical protein
VIASRLRAVSELYDARFIEHFEAGGEAALAAAIGRLRTDPERRAELSETGKLAQSRNGWAVQRVSYLGVFPDLLGGQGHVASTPQFDEVSYVRTGRRWALSRVRIRQ